MATKIYWIHTFDNHARIGIMARPRGNDWLEDEMRALKNQSVNFLVSLLEIAEIQELELEDEKQYCEAFDIQYLNFPIPDRGVPQNNILPLLNRLTQQIENGKSVVVHCRMGIGRSSIIAAAALLKFGHNVDELMEKIGNIRGLTVPDTPTQVDWLNALPF